MVKVARLDLRNFMFLKMQKKQLGGLFCLDRFVSGKTEKERENRILWGYRCTCDCLLIYL
jgi:hypothetical protein